MRSVLATTALALESVALLVACASESGPAAPRLQAMSFATSEWSEPANVGAPVNSTGDEFGATLSPGGLSIYVASNRTDLPGAQGGNDIWVSHRACEDCPWGTPVNLGAPINSAAGEATPTFTPDGHVMFFNSARTGGAGRSDIYMSRRTDVNDDLSWEAPVNLGSDVNTPDNEGGPAYQQAGAGPGTLYFSRGLIPQQQAEIYVVSVTRDGETLGPAVPVAELNDPSVNDGALTVRQDGRELIFWSNRGSLPGHVVGDLFVSTRRSVHDAWSEPENLGAPVNTALDEVSARLSHDGRILLITSARPGGLGGTLFGFDIWMSTRTPSGH